MDPARLNDWESLFAQALTILDAAAAAIGPFTWSFGGGTALMLKYRHRYSKDIDIFLRDPQFIGHVTPRLSNRDAAAIHEIAPVIRDHRDLLMARVERHRAVLEEEYAGLELLDTTKSFAECVAALERSFAS